MENYIRSTRHNSNQFRVTSKHPFFKNEYLITKITEDCLIFSIPTIDYRGKSYKTHPCKNTKDFNACSITSEFMREGKFEIDEDDSDEDQLYIYF